MNLTISFPGTEQTTLSEVGGKGYSLIRMVEAGLPVPPGTVLTTEFFKPWFDEIKVSSTWLALAEATPDKWASLCNELKERCLALTLTETQYQALEGLRKNLAALGDNALLAVRSSSPEEDLASASFAGSYKTRLGVHPADLEEAVRHCFASSLDERVFVYKKERGFDVMSPRIAVIVQQQINSEVAGVGFTINPLTNDYDEAVIDANWGLGDSVVAGLVSPDHFIVDKVSRQIIEKKLGAKQVSIWLDPDCGWCGSFPKFCGGCADFLKTRYLPCCRPSGHTKHTSERFMFAKKNLQRKSISTFLSKNFSGPILHP